MLTLQSTSQLIRYSRCSLQDPVGNSSISPCEHANFISAGRDIHSERSTSCRRSEGQRPRQHNDITPPTQNLAPYSSPDKPRGAAADLTLLLVSAACCTTATKINVGTKLGLDPGGCGRTRGTAEIRRFSVNVTFCVRPDGEIFVTSDLFHCYEPGV